MAGLQKGQVTFYNLDGDETQKEMTEIIWDAQAAEKAGFEYFMMKEIHEQPKTITDMLGAFIRDGGIDLSEVGMTDERIKSISHFYIVACGEI